MPDLLLAVGGTGQHMALAISRLVFLGALPKMELAVVDADDGGELSKSLKTFGNTVIAGYTEHPLINGSNIYAPFDKAAKKDPKFMDLFLTSQSSQKEKDIFEVCFEKESADLLVKDGMFGRPSVGVTIFVQNKKTKLQTVFQRAGAVGNNSIFVTGSFVGGTGAGLLHHLIEALHNSYGTSMRIYGLIFLRWFRAPTGTAEQTINDESLDRNMRYGMDYFFQKTRKFVQATLLLGFPDNPPNKKLEPVFLEAGKNEEKKHFFHLASAKGVLTLPTINTTQQDPGTIYGVAIENPSQMYEETWLKEKPLSWYVNRAEFVKEILDYASSEKFKKELSSVFNSWKIWQQPYNVGQGLYDAIKQSPMSDKTVVIEEITKTWRFIAKQYEFCLQWVDDILDPLPQRKYLPSLQRVKSSDDAIIKEIQKIWKTPIVFGQEPLTVPAIAQRFSNMLVDAFEE